MADNDGFVDVTHELNPAPASGDGFVDVSHELQSAPKPAANSQPAAVSAANDGFQDVSHELPKDSPYANGIQINGVDTSKLPQGSPDDPSHLEINPTGNQNESSPQVSMLNNMVKSVNDSVIQPIGNVLSKPLQALQVPASAIGHIVARYTDPELLKYAQQKQQEDGLVKGFLEAPVLTGDALEKHIENGAFHVANAISPQGDWEKSSPGFRQGVASFVGGMTPFLSHVAAMGINILTDPLVMAGVASKVGGVAVATDASEASTLAKTAAGTPVVSTGEFAYVPTPEQVLTNVDPETLLKRSLGQDVEGSNKAIFDMKLPGSDTPFLKIKGQGIANVWDRIRADFWSSKLGQNFLSKFSSQSNFVGADAVLEAHSIETQGNAYLTKMAGDSLTPLDENIIRHASLQGEFPNSYPDVAAKMKLPALSPEETVASMDRQAAWASFDQKAQVQMEKVGGHIPKFQPADAIEQAKTIQDMLKKGQITPTQAELFSQMGFSEDRGFGRAMTQEAADVFDQLTKSGKAYGDAAVLKDKTASLNERSKLSTPAQNILWGERLGLKEPFNPNTDQVVLRNFSQNLQAASDIKLIKGVTEGYGRSLDGWAQVIANANREVELAKTLGVPVNQETLMFHGLDPQAFAKHTNFTALNPLEGGEISQASTSLDTSKLSKMPGFVWDRVAKNLDLRDEPNLYYPNSVVEQISSRFNRANPGTILAAMDKLNMAWAKNALTSVSRLTLDAFTGAFAFWNERGDWSKVLDVSRELSGETPRSNLGVIFDNSPMKKSYYDALEVRHEVPVSAEILENPQSHAAIEDFFTSMQKVSKNQGSIDPLIKQWNARLAVTKAGDVVDGTLNFANKINDLAPFKWLRERGPAMSNIFKEAYYRTLVEERGINPQAAMSEVNRAFLDFSTPTPSGTQVLQRVYPFANFMLKNAGRVIPLLLDRPGAVNVLNPYNGYLKKAIEDYAGYSPQQVAMLQQTAGPFPHDPVLATVLHGAVDVMNQKDLVKKFINQYVMALAPQGSQNQLQDGYRLMFRLPTHLGAASEMVNMLNPMQNQAGGEISYGPLVKAGLSVTLGLDPFTGEKLKYDNDQINSTHDRMVAAAQQLNPLNFSKLMNGVIKPGLDMVVPKWRENLENLGMPGKAAQTLISVLSNGRDENVAKVDETVLKTLTNYKFFGLGYLTAADKSYEMFQYAQYRNLQAIVKNAAREKDPAIRQRELDAFNQAVKQLNFNAKVYQDYNARTVRDSGLQKPDPKLNFQMGVQ